MCIITWDLQFEESMLMNLRQITGGYSAALRARKLRAVLGLRHISASRVRCAETSGSRNALLAMMEFGMKGRNRKRFSLCFLLRVCSVATVKSLVLAWVNAEPFSRPTTVGFTLRSVLTALRAVLGLRHIGFAGTLSQRRKAAARYWPWATNEIWIYI